MNEIPLREGTVAAAKPEEEGRRTEEILRSDWTLAAVKEREEQRLRQEEKQRAIKTFVSDWNTAFKQKEEDERRKKKQAAEAAVVGVKQAEISEAKIGGEQVEAIRRAKVEWRDREGAAPSPRAFEADHQRERDEIHAAPKSGVVRSRGATKWLRGVLWSLVTVAIWGAIGFGAGVYTTPPDKADEFRAFVNSKLEEMDALIQREWAATEPRPKAAPSDASAPVAPVEVPVQPAAEAPAGDAAGQKDAPRANAAPPSQAPADSSNSQSAAPIPSAERAAPAIDETPLSAKKASQTKPIAKKATIAKPHPKPAVEKAKPKPKPKPKPVDEAPAAAEPAQQ